MHAPIAYQIVLKPSVKQPQPHVHFRLMERSRFVIAIRDRGRVAIPLQRHELRERVAEERRVLRVCRRAQIRERSGPSPAGRRGGFAIGRESERFDGSDFVHLERCTS